MKMYLVRRYEDSLPEREYGVSDGYYAVGLFDSEEKANEAKEKAIALAKTTDYKDEYGCITTEIDILTIELNKTYKQDDQIYLGGGFYIE